MIRGRRPRNRPSNLQMETGGEIVLAFQETFWSPGFGVLIDQFGVPWEINSVQSASSA